MSRIIGDFLNGIGAPGFVRDCEYRSRATDARVSVRRSPYYTVITVNGLDVYFHRLTGKIDGVGLGGLDQKPDKAWE